MKIKVLYFGELRELVKTAQETVELAEGSSVGDLVHMLQSRPDPWQGALNAPDPLRIAVNQEMAQANTMLSTNAEVALFRPVTGG